MLKHGSLERAVGKFLPSAQPNIIMFHLGRCGSTVLSRSLGQHPQIQWAGEILHNYWTEQPDVSMESYLESYSVRRTKLAKFIGAELKLWELDLISRDVLWAIDKLRYRKQSIRVVLLTRKNLVRKLVSSLRSHSSGVWHISSKDIPSNHTPEYVELSCPNIRYTRGTFLDILEAYKEIQNKAMEIAANNDWLNLQYEKDVMVDPMVGYNKILKYIGLHQFTVEPSLVKMNEAPLSQLVGNFDELEKTLAGTEFEEMIYWD